MSDSNAIFRSALTIGGAFFFGAPGAVIGGIIGDVLFPVTLPGQEGPRLNELNFQRSTVGAPIPICYGTTKLAGNVIFTGGLIEEVNREEQGGKGSSPSQTVTTYTYFVDVAIGICDGEDGRPSKPQGIKRIWAYGDCIYDASPQGYDETDEAFAERLAMTTQTLEMMTIYPGDEDQLPSPLIESYKGAGAVPAYRGLYHVEFEHFPLAKFGNAIPNFLFEVYTGTATEEDCSQFTAGHLEQWQYQKDNGVHDPRNPDNLHLYADCMGGLTFPHHTFDSALASMNAPLVGLPGEPRWVVSESPQGPDSDYIRGWALSSTPNFSQPCDADDPSAPSLAVDRVTVTMNLNTIRDDPNSCRVNVSGGLDFYGCAGLWIELGTWNNHAWFNAGDGSGFYVLTENNVYPTIGGSPPAPWDGRGDCSPPGMPTTNKWASFDQEMCVMRWWAPQGCENGIPLAGAPGFCIVDGVVTRALTWTRVSGTFKSLRGYQMSGSFGVVESYPKDPTIRSDHDDYNNQSFWEAAYADAVAANAGLPLGDPNIIPEDWVYGVDYPNETFSHISNIADGIVWQASCSGPVVETECVPMALIVEDLCDRAGLPAAQTDVSGLTTCVDGYVVTRQMTARDALTPLRMFGLWDCVESGTVLRFVERGAAIVATLTSDDLGVAEGNSEAPSVMETSRVQEKDLPRRVRLHYADIDQSHEPGEQAASRISTEATNELDVELAISMDGDYAAQLAEIMLYEAWVSRSTYRFTLDNTWLALEPADCLEIPVDGETQRVRILAIDYSIGGILRIEAVRDDDGSYESTAVATPPGETGSGSGGTPGSALVCPSVLTLLDLPRLRDVDIDCGYYAAVYGLCDSWTCAAIYRSSDGGTTYGRVARTDLQATVGTATFTDVPDEESSLLDSPISYDTVNTISVTLGYGTLSSVTDDQIEAGFNAAAVGVDGRWVIIQFQTAVLDSSGTWVLSNILWGLRETAEHLDTLSDGDTFVLLNDTALLRIDETAANEGVPKLFKVVTCGESIEDVEPITFRTQCLSFKPDLIAEDPPPAPDEDDPASTCTQLLIWNVDSGQYEPAPLYLQQLCNVAFDSSVVVGDVLSYVGEDSSGPLFGFVPQTGGDSSDTSVGILGALELIEEAVVTGSPQQTLLINGLDLDEHEEYVAIVFGDNATAGTIDVSLYFNGDTTDSNYRRQLTRQSGTIEASERTNDATIAEVVPAGDVFGFQFTLRRNFDGHPHAIFHGYDGDAGSLRNFVGNMRREVSANVTSLQITASAASALSVGTTIRLFRLGTTGGTGSLALDDLTDVAIGSPLADGDVLVYDESSGNWINAPAESVSGSAGGGGWTFVDGAVLSSPGTTLTVTGLDLAVDVVYYFEFITDNQSGGTNAYRAFVNNDTTVTNYDRGRVGMNSATLGSSGANDATMVSGLSDGLPTTIHGWIRHNFDGKTLIVGQDADIETSTRIGGWWQIQHRTVANMTRFDVVADANMPTGSALRIYRMGGSGDTGGGGGGGDVDGPGSSTDNALVRFDGTTGKLIQNSATILSDADEVSTPNASAAEIGFKGIPQRSISGNDTLVLTDAGGQVYKGSGGTVTVTIPANGTVAFPIGSCVEIINDDTETMTIAITTDTLVLSPSGSTGSRSLAARGWAVIKKVTSTRWFISGVGLT